MSDSSLTDIELSDIDDIDTRPYEDLKVGTVKIGRDLMAETGFQAPEIEPPAVSPEPSIMMEIDKSEFPPFTPDQDIPPLPPIPPRLKSMILRRMQQLDITPHLQKSYCSTSFLDDFNGEPCSVKTDSGADVQESLFSESSETINQGSSGIFVSGIQTPPSSPPAEKALAIAVPSTANLNLGGNAPSHNPPTKRKKNQRNAPGAAKRVKTAVNPSWEGNSTAPTTWAPKIGVSGVGCNKPFPIGQPPLWADTRSDLCDTAPYFRAFQCGAYCKEGICYGYLIDGSSVDRDIILDRVVISHCGGRSDSRGEGLLSNQSEGDKYAVAMKNNKLLKVPVTLILGDKCPHSPVALPHKYNIMDTFKVTHVWAEKERSHVRVKFRFEKLQASQPGWWSPHYSEEPAITVPVVEQLCTSCGESSPHVYQVGWMCLFSQCGRFWTLPNGAAPLEKDLIYTQNFLSGRTPWEPKGLEQNPYDLLPMHATFHAGNEDSHLVRSAWKGMACPNCGRCNARILWCGFVCLYCFFWLSPKRTKLEPLRLEATERPLYSGPVICTDVWDSSIKPLKFWVDGFTVLQYELPDGIGTVTHMLANRETNAREYDCDWLLEQYQQPDLPFMRKEIGYVPGEGLTRHFAFNVGAPYKYVVDQDTIPLDQAPRCTQRAMDLLKYRVTLAGENSEFNELLSIGYYEDQTMGYHDDGEKGLGPVVASISLGGPAEMLFRKKRPKMKKPLREKVRTDRSKDHGLVKFDVADKIAESDDELREDEGEGGMTNDNVRKKGMKQDVLKLRLHHGDIMIMSGARIQELYEHSVRSTGLFRVACTARLIDVAENAAEKTHSHMPSPYPPLRPTAEFHDDLRQRQRSWSPRHWGAFLAANVGMFGLGENAYALPKNDANPPLRPIVPKFDFLDQTEASEVLPAPVETGTQNLPEIQQDHHVSKTNWDSRGVISADQPGRLAMEGNEVIREFMGGDTDLHRKSRATSVPLLTTVRMGPRTENGSRNAPAQTLTFMDLQSRSNVKQTRTPLRVLSSRPEASSELPVLAAGSNSADETVNNEQTLPAPAETNAGGQRLASPENLPAFSEPMEPSENVPIDPVLLAMASSTLSAHVANNQGTHAPTTASLLPSAATASQISSGITSTYAPIGDVEVDEASSPRH